MVFLIEVNEFEDIGVVDGCPFDEETVVISELLLAVDLKFIGINNFLGDCVFISVGVELQPVFGKEV